MATRFVERQEVLEMLNLAFHQKEHALLLGAPGTAKTLLVQEFAALVGGTFFHRLLTPFSTPEEVLGPVNLQALQEGRYERITDGFLPNTEIAFLDEVFKANSAILNSLLDIMEYRRLFISPTQMIDCPLRMLVGASNEYPQNGELAAFADRFLYRAIVHYVSDAGFLSLLMGGGDEIRLASAPRHDADASAIAPLFLQLRKQLREYGITASDRRWVKAFKAVALNAALRGDVEAKPEDILALRFIIPAPNGDIQLVENILYEVAIPEIAQFRQVLQQVEQEFAEATTTEKQIAVLSHIKTALGAIQRVGSDKLAPIESRLRELAELLKAQLIP